MLGYIRLLYLGLGLFALAGVSACGETELAGGSASTNMRVDTVSFLNDAAAEGDLGEAEELFESRLGLQLYGAYGFNRGSDLLLVYRFLTKNEGDEIIDWVFGGTLFAEGGELIVEVVFKDQAGNEIDRIQVTSERDSGWVGGTWEDALAAAADEVALYTNAHYKAH